MNPTFYHRGSDGKVKLPWVMPLNEDMCDAQGNSKAGEVSGEMMDILGLRTKRGGEGRRFLDGRRMRLRLRR